MCAVFDTFIDALSLSFFSALSCAVSLFCQFEITVSEEGISKYRFFNKEAKNLINKGAQVLT